MPVFVFGTNPNLRQCDLVNISFITHEVRAIPFKSMGGGGFLLEKNTVF